MWKFVLCVASATTDIFSYPYPLLQTAAYFFWASSGIWFSFTLLPGEANLADILCLTLSLRIISLKVKKKTPNTENLVPSKHNMKQKPMQTKTLKCLYHAVKPSF